MRHMCKIFVLHMLVKDNVTQAESRVQIGKPQAANQKHRESFAPLELDFTITTLFFYNT